MSEIIRGIPASDGIAMAPVYVLRAPDLTYESRRGMDPSIEIDRLDQALAQAREEIHQIRQASAESLGEAKAQVFDAHLMIASDPDFIGQVRDQIQEGRVNAEAALDQVAQSFIRSFQTMEDNPYMQERAGDIKDVADRIMAQLLGVQLANPASISEEVVVVAHDLTPSDTAQLNKKYVKAFVTNIGGRTSHSAIMARSLEIPAIVGTDGILESVSQGDLVIVDAFRGEVVLRPSPEDLASYQDKLASYQEELAGLEDWLGKGTVSQDGHQVELVANIGTAKDVQGAIRHGAEGIGLYRTEFLYMGAQTLPSEEDQFEAYKQVLQAMEGRPVIVRTLDIGGDKELPYLTLPEEMNPFLGYRAIRISLDQPDIFRTQLRALIRASHYGHLKIMFPMIASLTEFRQARAIFQEEYDRLLSQGQPVADKIDLGIMVEIPSAAILADQFAKEVDFFSIGTNDLIQYSMAADRMNERVAYLYQPYHPAVLRLIKHVVDASHAEGKWTGMCGEMAGDPLAVPLLLGMGLDEFSMSASSILKVRKLISQVNQADMEALAHRAMYEAQTAQEVIQMVENQLA